MMGVMNGVIWLWLVVRAVVDSPIQAAVVLGGALALMVTVKLASPPKP